MAGGTKGIGVMSEAPVAITAAAGVIDTSGVLRLLEDDDDTHAASLSALSGTHHSVISGEGFDGSAPHHHLHDQAPVVSALQQTDESHSLGGSLVPLQQDQHQFSRSQLSPESVSSLHLSSPQNINSDVPANSTTETEQESMNSGFGLSSASPHSICLCQAPTRIPRPRNG